MQPQARNDGRAGYPMSGPHNRPAFDPANSPPSRFTALPNGSLSPPPPQNGYLPYGHQGGPVYAPFSDATYYYPQGFQPYMQMPYGYGMPAAPGHQDRPVPQNAHLLVDPPLDPTSYWVLGQIEFYMSEDNLARDAFLRDQVSRYKRIVYKRTHTFSRWMLKAG